MLLTEEKGFFLKIYKKGLISHRKVLQHGQYIKNTWSHKEKSKKSRNSHKCTVKKTREELKEIDGHMALRHNVNRIKLELWKEIRPLEYFLVDIIIEKTIGWQQKEASIKIDEFKEASIKIDEFMDRSGQKHTHIYVSLSNLEKEKVIIRRKVGHTTYYSLNEDYFGGLLIKRHEDALQARKKRIKVVVDNSKKFVPNSYKTCTESVQSRYEIRTQKETQNNETIDENMSLKKLFNKETSLKEKPPENGEKVSLSWENGIGGKVVSKQFKDPVLEKKRQLEELAKAKEAGLL